MRGLAYDDIQSQPDASSAAHSEHYSTRGDPAQRAAEGRRTRNRCR